MEKEGIEEVKRNNSILDVAARYGVHPNRQMMARCIFHEGDREASMKIYPSQNTFHCYGCNANGDIFSFVQLAEHCDFKTAYHILGGEDKEMSWAQKQLAKKKQERREESRGKIEIADREINRWTLRLSDLDRRIRQMSIDRTLTWDSLADIEQNRMKCLVAISTLDECKNEFKKELANI